MEVLLYYLLISGASLALGALLGRWLFLPLTWHKATRAFYLIILVSAWVIPLVGIVVPYIDWCSTRDGPVRQEGCAMLIHQRRHSDQETP